MLVVKLHHKFYRWERYYYSRPPAPSSHYLCSSLKDVSAPERRSGAYYTVWLVNLLMALMFAPGYHEKHIAHARSSLNSISCSHGLILYVLRRRRCRADHPRVTCHAHVPRRWTTIETDGNVSEPFHYYY